MRTRIPTRLILGVLLEILVPRAHAEELRDRAVPRDPEGVLVVTPPDAGGDPEVEQRLRAELEASGFSIRDTAAAFEEAIAIVTEPEDGIRRALFVVQVARLPAQPGGVRIRAFATNPDAGRELARSIDVDLRRAKLPVPRAALAGAELVHALLEELDLLVPKGSTAADRTMDRALPPEEPASPPTTFAAPPPPAERPVRLPHQGASRRLLGFTFGALALDPSRSVPPLPGAMVGAALALVSFGRTALLDLDLHVTAAFPAIVRSEVGSARIGVVWPEALLALTFSPNRSVRPGLALGIGAPIAWARGEAEPPRPTRTDVAATGALSLEPRLTIRLASRWSLRLSAAAALHVERIPIVLGESAAATLGRWAFRGGLSLVHR